MLEWLRAGRVRPPSFDRVECFLIFLGDGRTGSTLIGSLVDAHPDACVALEENALELVAAGVSRETLYGRLAANSARHRGRRWTGYRYRVRGQRQGRSEAPRVIGDKQAGIYTVRLVEEAGLWERLRATVAVPVKAIHSVRNPFDVIATRFRWRSRGKALLPGEREELLERLIADHFRICSAVVELGRRYGREAEVMDVHHEAFVADPQAMLRRICGFLGLEATPDYLSDCSRIVADRPRRTRGEVAWSERQRDEVARRARAIPFLRGYSYDA